MLTNGLSETSYQFYGLYIIQRAHCEVNSVPNDQAMYQSTFQTQDRVKGGLRKLWVNYCLDPPWSARTLYWRADSPSARGSGLSAELLGTENHH